LNATLGSWLKAWFNTSSILGATAVATLASSTLAQYWRNGCNAQSWHRNTWRNACLILGATLGAAILGATLGATLGGFSSEFFPPPSGDELPSRVEDELPPPGEIGGGEKVALTGWLVVEHRNRQRHTYCNDYSPMPLPTSSDH